MKKIKLISILILLSSQLFSQNVLDTICNMVAGNIHFKFNYYNSKIIQDTRPIENVELKLKNNQILVLDLYDNCECVKYNIVSKQKNITTVNFLGLEKTTTVNSSDTTLLFNGNKIKKVIIKQPKFREENPHDIRKN